jgi:hypothetical protein
LSSRFKVPVRYVVYSHSHFDHAGGGAVFADTARFVAHENMLRNIDGRYPHMPGDMVDRNHNGAIDPGEIDIPTNAAPGICGMGPGFFATIDRDKNGLVPPSELQATSPARHRLFGADAPDARRPHGGTAASGPESLRRRHGDAVPRVAGAVRHRVPGRRARHHQPRSLPSACSAFDRHPLAEWIRSYRTVEALDFDRVAPGHGEVFDKAVVTETREYFEYLVAQVSAGIRAGRPLADLVETITLDRYKGWANYERLRRMNVEAAYLNLVATP